MDLLLDGSASRLHCQETIAAQGYILAKSLLNCGIPVRVTSFCSLRGYTVLRVLKEYGDKQGERRIFDYFGEASAADPHRRQSRRQPPDSPQRKESHQPGV